MKVKINSSASKFILKCSKYPHGKIGYVIGKTTDMYQVQWPSGYRYWYKKEELQKVRLSFQIKHVFAVLLAFIVLAVVSLGALAKDNDDLAFDFVSSTSELNDIIYECKLTNDERVYLLSADISINTVDPRNYCDSLKTIADAKLNEGK